MLSACGICWAPPCPSRCSSESVRQGCREWRWLQCGSTPDAFHSVGAICPPRRNADAVPARPCHALSSSFLPLAKELKQSDARAGDEGGNGDSRLLTASALVWRGGGTRIPRPGATVRWLAGGMKRVPPVRRPKYLHLSFTFVLVDRTVTSVTHTRLPFAGHDVISSSIAARSTGTGTVARSAAAPPRTRRSSGWRPFGIPPHRLQAPPLVGYAWYISTADVLLLELDSPSPPPASLISDCTATHWNDAPISNQEPPGEDKQCATAISTIDDGAST